MSTARVTVTLPDELLQAIDSRDSNRSRFVLVAVKRELARRQREELRRSLRSPHPESVERAAEGVADWGGALPQEDATALVDPRAGRSVRWIPGKGWAER